MDCVIDIANCMQDIHLRESHVYFFDVRYHLLADLTVSKRPGTSDQIEIHFAIFIRLYLLFSFMKLVET